MRRRLQCRTSQRRWVTVRWATKCTVSATAGIRDVVVIVSKSVEAGIVEWIVIVRKKEAGGEAYDF